MRALLSNELDNCIARYQCHDLRLAKDVLRTYTCSIYDTLQREYNGRVAIWQCEEQIADEAIHIVLSCWSNFNVSPPASQWREQLFDTVVQHVGHPLRSIETSTGKQASAYARAGIDMASAAPLVHKLDAMAQAKRAGEQQASRPVDKTGTVEPSSRKALFDSYRLIIPGAGIMDICWAAEQHYREWARWLKGELKDGSKPDRAFRHVLTSGKDPRKLRRGIRPKDYK